MGFNAGAVLINQVGYGVIGDTMSEMATTNDMKTTKEIMSSMSEDDKKALKGWYFFDWANQAYALTVMTVIAPALMACLLYTSPSPRDRG